MTKKLFKLLIAIMLSPLVGMGQKDIVWRIGGTPIKIWPSYNDTALAGITFSTGSVDRLIIPTPKYDTVKVIMLISDTSRKNYSIVNTTFWIFGYEVIEDEGWWIRMKYIDENKKPLRKSIIVWQSKRFNP